MSKHSQQAIKQAASTSYWSGETVSERLEHCLDALLFWKVITPYEAKAVELRILEMNALNSTGEAEK